MGEDRKLCQGVMEDEDVIEVDNDMTSINKVHKYFFHDSLEGCGGVAEPKHHDQGFKEAELCLKGSFPFVPFFDADVVISPSDIQFCEVPHSA